MGHADGRAEGREVEFEVDGDEVRLRKSTEGTTRGQRLVEHMGGRLRGGMSTDELMALTRGEDDGTILV